MQEQERDGFDNDRKKKKPQHSFIPYTLITMCFILLFSLLSVGSYRPLGEHFLPQEDKFETYFESQDFLHALAGLNRYHLSNSKYTSRVEGEYWYDNRYENLESIQYYITNDEETTYISNRGEGNVSDINQEIENSLFYLYIEADEEGDVEIESSLHDRFNERDFMNMAGLNHEYRDKYAGLKFIYIVPQDFEAYNDFFTYNMKRFHVLPKDLFLILAIAGISIFLLVIIAFSIPYPFQKKTVVCAIFNKLFLELKALVWLLFGIATMMGVSILSNYNAYNSLGFNIVEAIYDVDSYFYLIGVPVTFVLFFLTYLTIVYVKYIYYTGFKEGFIKNSVIGRMGYYFIKKLRQMIQEVMVLTITKEPQKEVFVILVINLLILWLIALGGGIFFLLAVLYSILLFKYFVKFMVNMKALHESSSQLAEGEFDIKLDEDIGMLRPIAENLNNIKEGFQLAIDKEIQSEKMKTELISNVSHDLKTPLTSIITYIDLLKEEGLNSATQQEYLEILDKKSKRLKVLIEDLFEATKANSGNIQLQLEEVDVIALFRQTLGELEEKIKESSLQIKTNLPENKVICELDGERTYRVFENIMSNIFKYSMENSRVYIDVVENQQEVNFIFKNISSYEMNFDAKEITERFARGDKSRSTEGSGLGLSIAKSFVEIQKGNLNIDIDGDLFKLTVTFPIKSTEGNKRL
ncbi:MAG: GHKL domain-containing protein [Clostridiaceae bacterium]|nr:GHKL domain-containing protein [Clostridiaceae bacterium]